MFARALVQQLSAAVDDKWNFVFAHYVCVCSPKLDARKLLRVSAALAHLTRSRARRLPSAFEALAGPMRVSMRLCKCVCVCVYENVCSLRKSAFS